MNYNGEEIKNAYLINNIGYGIDEVIKSHIDIVINDNYKELLNKIIIIQQDCPTVYDIMTVKNFLKDDDKFEMVKTRWKLIFDSSIKTIEVNNFNKFKEYFDKSNPKQDDTFDIKKEKALIPEFNYIEDNMYEYTKKDVMFFNMEKAIEYVKSL